MEEFKRNIASAGLEELVTPIVKTSQDAAASFQDLAELLFIDGAHDYASTKADFHAWFPKLVDGGVVALHDTTGGTVQGGLCSKTFAPPGALVEYTSSTLLPTLQN